MNDTLTFDSMYGIIKTVEGLRCFNLPIYDSPLGRRIPSTSCEVNQWAVVFGDNMETKVCSECGEERTLDEFHADRTKKDGKRTICKICARFYNLHDRKYNYKSKKQEYIISNLSVRVCDVCGIEKPLDEFYAHRHPERMTNRINRKRACPCKECEKKRLKKWELENHERRIEINSEYRKRNRHLLNEKQRQYNYGITPDEYRGLLITQNNCCPICGNTFGSNKGDIHIDHNHITGKVRALLCGKCNCGLGYFKESVDNLMSAIAYLEKWKE